MRLAFPICLSLCLWAANVSNARAKPLNTAMIEQITGRAGTFDPKDGVFKISVPRNDISVFVGNWPLPPLMGLTSWAAFSAGLNGNALVEGHIVLFQDEVNPALSTALDHGLCVTALHGSFLFDEPKVYFMHISGRGDLKTLALGVRKVLAAAGKIRAAHPNLAATFGGLPPPCFNAISGRIIENILGVKGQASDGMFKVVIGRSARITGINLGKDMGVDTWAAFAGVDENAIVDGAFAVRKGELQGVLKALRKGGINITAINNHMVDETPRIIFVSYWGKGDIRDLAKTLKAALDLEAKLSREHPIRS